MNRAQRRNLLKVKNKPKHNRASVAASKAEEGITASNAQGIIDNLPIAQIVAGVNNLLRQLEKRQVPVYDWDNEGRTLYRLQMRRGKVFYLAEQKKPGQGSPEGK